MIASVKSLKKTVTTAGTAEALTSSRTIAQSLRIKALSGNVGSIFVGDSTVSATTGFALGAGQEVVLEMTTRPFDLSALYIDAAAGGEGVTVIYQD